MMDLLPHDSVGWFLLLLWIGLIAFGVGVFFFCALQAIWQWFAGREERRYQRYLSSLRETLRRHDNRNDKNELPHSETR